MTAAINREAYADASEALASATASASGAEVFTVADEILSVAGLLRAQPRLRRALTDPSRSGRQRSEFVRSLLAGKLSQTTVDAVATLVAGRFASPMELWDTTERLGVDALLTASERIDELSEVEDELFRFGQVVSANPDLAVTLGDPGASVQRRVKLVEDLLKGRVRLGTGRLIEVALTGFGGRSFQASLTRLVELTAAKRDREVAYVTVARLMTADEEQRLAAKLSTMYGRQVSLKVDVDPSVIGGVSVRVGSDLYDGTILRRLIEAKQAFAK